MRRRFLFLAVLLLMCVPASSQGQTRPAEPVAAIPAQQSLHDHFIGWYRLSRRTQSMQVVEKGPATFIPIFKRNGTYYTVCRFFEVPMKVVPDGLECDIKPSSMVGTKITFDAHKKEYAITVHDSAAQGHDEEISGMLQPMRKVEAPFAVADPTAKAPKTNDDFVGWYEAVWASPLRYQIRKEGDKFIAEGQIVGREDRREPAFELQPLADSLGFKMGSRGKALFIYNQQLQRYEIAGRDSGPGMPLKRSDSEPPKELPKHPDVASVGIPSWH